MFRLGGLPLLLLFLYQLAVQAVDAPSVLGEPATCADGCSTRSLYNIIWGCVSTTIICAWAAVHANIPPREGPVKRVFRKIEMMFWAIVAPEFLPTWALNQRQAATIIRDLYNEKVYRSEIKPDQKQAIPKILTTLKTFFSFYGVTEAPSFAWTRKHGHFLIMGGFHLIEPVEREAIVPSTLQTIEEGRAPVKDGRVTILTLEMFRVLLDDQIFRDRIRITAEEIADKSKGDELAKFILVIQALWFICQCVARHYQDLTVTQLELTTLALASLNGITLWLWKDKPLGVDTPVRVYMDRELSDKERAIEGRGNSERSKFLESFHPKNLKRPNPFLVLIFSPFLILALLVLPITNAFKSTLSDILTTSRSFPADAKHVPTFYVPEHGYREHWQTPFLLVFATIFGAIHIAGWNLPFPTEAERKLWRIASIIVACLPIATLAVLFIISYLILLCRGRSSLTKVLDYSTDPMLAYVAARLMLLGLAVALLRHQPPSAFIAVDWSKFYPHFL